MNSQMVFDALSADDELLRRLARQPDRDASIHSVFAHALNLCDDRVGWLTIACAGADDAPDTVITNLHDLGFLHLQPGQLARCSSERLLLENGAGIRLGAARRWRGRLPAYGPNSGLLAANLAAAEEQLAHEETGSAASGAFARAASDLLQALLRGDLPRAQCHAGQLVGLGPGLTPAGDDFLTGLLAVLNIPGSPGHALRCIGSNVVECATRRTHAISLAQLRHAANGRARERVVRLCEVLMHGSTPATHAAMTEVLKIGSTSGTDLAAGVLSAFALHLRLQDIT